MKVSNEMENINKIPVLEMKTDSESGATQNHKALLDTNKEYLSSSASKKWDFSRRRNLKSRKHPALIAIILKKSLNNEITQAKLELVQLQKEFLAAKIAEKRKVWEFEENERRKEAEFKEKERKWKEDEYKLKLQLQF